MASAARSTPGKGPLPVWQGPEFAKSIGDAGGPAPGPPPVDDSLPATAHARYVTTGHPKDADAYLSAIKPWMTQAVRAYAGPAAGPAVFAKAKTIALDAASKFDPARGVKLRTFLTTHWQGLRRAAARESSPVRLPEQTAIDAARLAKHEEDLRGELGRDPSDGELADRTGLSLTRLARARGAGGFIPESLAPDGADLILPGPSRAARDAWIRFVHTDLAGGPDQLVLEHTLGLGGKKKLSTAELARKLGVSPGAVSQRRARIEKILSEYEGIALGTR